MPMRMSDSKNRAVRIAYDSAFLALALMLSFAESVLLPAGILPFPGAKLGLANAAVLLCAAVCGKADAAFVSLCRVLISFILFGNASSLVYSFLGAVFALIGLFAVCTEKSPFSFLGKSLLCAALHNIGQLFAAFLLIGNENVFLMTPWLIISSQICGCITGILLNISYKSVEKLRRKE